MPHKFTCACGTAYDNRKELRCHIALANENWPSQRCTYDHHDPLDDVDQMHLRWQDTVGRARHAK